MKKVEVQQKRFVFDDFFKVEEAIVRYEKYDGSMSSPVRRLNFERGDAVAVLVFNRDTEKIILVEQFRYPVHETCGGWVTEVVAGILEKGETPHETAIREVEEEIGYRIPEVVPVSTFYTSPGGSSERIFLYYVEVTDEQRVSEGGGVETEHEDIRLKEYSPEQLWHAMEAGEFPDSKTLVALMWFKDQRKNQSVK